MNELGTFNNLSIKPNLTINDDIPMDGIDLIMNKKVKGNASDMFSVSSGNSRIISDTDDSSIDEEFNNNTPNNTPFVSSTNSPSFNKNNNWDDDTSEEDNEEFNNNKPSININNNVPSHKPEPQKDYFQDRIRTEEEILNMKRKILYQFDRLEKKELNYLNDLL